MKGKIFDILAIGAHPDDVELGCGATLLKQIAMGHKVAILDLTKGELGTRGSAKLRLEEAQKAAEYAGISQRTNLGLRDGLFENNEENKLAIVRQLRKFRPEIVLANAVKDRHPDHGNAAKLIDEACFLSGLKKVETHDDKGPQEKWRPRKLLNYIQDFNLKPDVVVDISDFMEKKIEMVSCFRSQFFDPESQEEETAISRPDFFDFLRSRAKLHGRHINAEYGEGFTCSSYIGIGDIMKIL